MSKARATLAQAQQLLQDTLRETRRVSALARERIVNPPRFQKVADGATRTGQVVSLFFLGPVIVVCFQLIRVVNNLMSDVLGTGLFEAGQFDVMAFIVTGLTLGLLVMCAWGWFQFVKTAGFGAFS